MPPALAVWLLFEALVRAVLCLQLIFFQLLHSLINGRRCQSLRTRRVAVAVQCVPKPAALAYGWSLVATVAGATAEELWLARASPAHADVARSRVRDGRRASGSVSALALSKKRVRPELSWRSTCKADRRTNFSERCHCAELKLKLVRDPQAKHTTSAIWQHIHHGSGSRSALSRRRPAHGHPCAGQPQSASPRPAQDSSDERRLL